MKGGPGFGAVIWIVFGISALGTMIVALSIRLFFRRRKMATDI